MGIDLVQGNADPSCNILLPGLFDLEGMEIGHQQARAAAVQELRQHRLRCAGEETEGDPFRSKVALHFLKPPQHESVLPPGGAGKMKNDAEDHGERRAVPQRMLLRVKRRPLSRTRWSRLIQ
jgi:hypothetical protein